MYQLNETEAWREHRNGLLREAEAGHAIRHGWGPTVRMALGFLTVALLVAASISLASRPAHADTTFTVNFAAFDAPDLSVALNGRGDGVCDADFDPGQQCTLRAAIQEANATPGSDIIRFGIPDDPGVPGNEVKTISLTSELPDITETATIDGYSQPGSSPNTNVRGAINAKPLVQLDGTNIPGTSRDGLRIAASDVVVRGLVINRFDAGIKILSSDASSDNNRIEGNFIGTDPTGTQALDAGFGVDVLSDSENTIVGGTSPAARNLISGNDSDGIFIDDASGTRVLGNLIGTKKDGTTALGNANEGVDLINAERTIVGGTALGAANTIAFNGDDGVLISGRSSAGNRILGNSIFANGGLGIDLSEEDDSGDGPTPNDLGDVDIGPNDLQNKPVITSAKTAGGKTTVKGRLNSTPTDSFQVQFFSNASGNEGKKFLGTRRVSAHADGKVTFTFTSSRSVAAGQGITATARDEVNGNTSEFSAPRQVVAG